MSKPSDDTLDLEACPFCGGVASFGTVKYDPRTVREQKWPQAVFHYVNCQSCGVTNNGLRGFDTPAKAAAHWNARLRAPSGAPAEWKPISEAPKDGTDVLTLRYDMGRPMMAVGRWDKNRQGSGYYGDEGWMYPGYQGIAHVAISPPPVKWHPLPPAPQPEQRTYSGEPEGLEI